MYDDSIFFLFFEVIKYFFSELIPRNVAGKNKSLFSRMVSATVILLIGFICIAIITTLCFIILFTYVSSENIKQTVITTILSLVIIISIISLLIVLPKYLIEFDSFEDEINFSKIKGLSKHTVLLILQETKNDCFVLANFDDYIGIRPAVYKKRRKRIGLIDLYQKTTWYKKIFLDKSENNDNNDIRILRIKNKSSKTQMIVFTTKINSLDIYINNVKIPKIDFENKIGEFYLYGKIENSKTMNCTTVNINGSNYNLMESKANKFIGKDELINTGDG